MFTSNMHQYLHAHLQAPSPTNAALICKSKRFLSAQRLFKHLLYFCNWKNQFNERSLKIVVFFLMQKLWQFFRFWGRHGRRPIVSCGLILHLALFLPDVYKALVYVTELWNEWYKDMFIKLKYNKQNMDHCRLIIGM